MSVQSKEDLTYYQIYRPVIADEELESFMDKAHHHGLKVFGTVINTVITTEIASDQNEVDADSRGMETRGVRSSRLDVYANGQLRLPLFERSTLPEMNYGGKFSTANRRLIKNPAETVYHSIERSPEEKEVRRQRRKHDSLAFIFEQIGREYDIVDQHNLEVPCRMIDLAVDPSIEHLGLEVLLVPDPKSKVTQMLIKQAGVCMRGIKSRRVAYPSTPTSLRIPFARMPPDAHPRQITDFLTAMEKHLPQQRVTLGGFRDIVGGASWQSIR